MGTFSHQALLTLPPLGSDPVPYATVGQALQAVRDGEITAALVPIENSVEGGVSATLDNLTYGDPLVITREVVLPVQFDLYGRPGLDASTTSGTSSPTRTPPPSAATGWPCTCPRPWSPRAGPPPPRPPRWPIRCPASTPRSARRWPARCTG